MYNKIFTKILDSSIWLETDSTRIVWLTLIAAMDETGFTQFASPANLAHRARVTLEAAEAAIALLEGPDHNSSDPEHEGRRIERVPGGWMVLNSAKYREMVTRAVGQEKTRERVARFRAKKAGVTLGNDPVTVRNDSVTPSEAATEAKSEGRKAAVAAPTSDEWIAGLACHPAYVGIDVRLQFQKMLVWCGENKKPASRRRFVNWLNRCDRSISAGAPSPYAKAF